MAQIKVAEYYAGKSIFITGATGYIGKALVEKLLRCCPEVKTMYIMVRKKKGKSAESRLGELLESRVFEKLIKQNPKATSKIKPICGDILEEHLGMPISDIEVLQRECQIVFNNAACVRDCGHNPLLMQGATFEMPKSYWTVCNRQKFDMTLREAVKFNTIGLMRVLKLAEGMKKLEAFVHVSTAFCHDDLEIVEEKMYPSKHNPMDVIDTLKWMDDEILSGCQSTIIKPYPNTYGYSKCLGEQVLANHAGKFPIAVGRPSIVLPAMKEPFPGWFDNINGPTGILYAASRGVLHSMYCNFSSEIDTIPLDFTINALILLGYTTGMEKPKEIRVCNLTQSGVIKMTWIDCSKLWTKYAMMYPLSYSMWYPVAKGKRYKIEHEIDAFFTHVLPAYFVDLLLFLFGQKTFMRNVVKRVTTGMEILQYYNKRNWNFKNDYYRSLDNKITEDERKVFYTNFTIVDTEKFMENYAKGLREFYCKEDWSTLPKARKLLKRLYYLHISVVYLIYVTYMYIVYWIYTNIFSFDSLIKT